MRRWIVRLNDQRAYDVEVTADSWTDARHAALDLYERCAFSSAKEVRRRIHSDPLRQLGEPWCELWRDDRLGAPVLVLQCAYGHVFDAPDVALLLTRLHRLGVQVYDHWNGVGCDQISFETDRPLQQSEVAYLCASRDDPKAPHVGER